MIAKQIKGRSFGGVLKYILSKDRAEMVGGNMLGTTAKQLTAEFNETRKLKPNLERAVYHTSLSLPPGESLSNEKWQEVAQTYLDGMGFSKSQYVAVRHRDTPHDHIHIVASRIGMDGKVVSESHDFRRSETIVRGLEMEYGLQRVLPSREVPSRAPTSGELHKVLREQTPTTKLRLQHLVDEAAHGQPTMSAFFQRLHARNVETIPNRAKTGHVSGISFSLEGEVMKGSDLGRAYTWAGLQKMKGVSYEPERDRQAIQNATERLRGYGSLERASSTFTRERQPSNRAVGERSRAFGRSVEDRVHGGERNIERNQERYQDVSRYSGSRGHDLSTDRISKYRNDLKSVDSQSPGRAPRERSSFERVLRMGLAIYQEGARNSNQMGTHSENRSSIESGLGRTGRKIPEAIREALKPFDEERDRRERKEPLEREKSRELLEKNRGKGLSRGKGKGFGIDFF
ncbi:MAG TPA: relaxase/mobilization nuclease domain-containing protein [Bdellovibrionota bacterium]|nr:relaxase/mobilization nuclease domain-containing protein [Bdellovibrionota bacterium]